MEATHTPGPWRVGRWGARFLVEADAGPVCSISKGVAEEADAHLIAAAKDMLEALQMAEDALSRAPFSTGIWPNGIHPNTGIQKIRDAIAKAIGAESS
jgi:hypothetical protein